MYQDSIDRVVVNLSMIIKYYSLIETMGGCEYPLVSNERTTAREGTGGSETNLIDFVYCTKINSKSLYSFTF